MSSVLILGGSYFIGPAVVKTFVDAGWSVTILNRGSRIVRGVGLAVANRDNAGEFESVMKKYDYFDVVVDLSCYKLEQAKLAYSLIYKRCAHWLFVSSAAVYRPRGNEPALESWSARGGPGWGEYGVQKALCESWLESQKNGPRLTILRPTYVYGPQNYADRETYVWARLLRNRPILIPKRQQHFIQFVHVFDLATAIYKLCEIEESGDRVFNVAHPLQYTIESFILACAEAAGVTAKLRYVSDIEKSQLLVDAKAAGISNRLFVLSDIPMSVNPSLLIQRIQTSPVYNLLGGLRQVFANYSISQLQREKLDTYLEDRLLSGG